MGCGSSNSSEGGAPGKYVDDPDMNDEKRIKVDKKTGIARECDDNGKDESDREDDFFEVEEA